MQFYTVFSKKKFTYKITLACKNFRNSVRLSALFVKNVQKARHISFKYLPKLFSKCAQLGNVESRGIIAII